MSTPPPRERLLGRCVISPLKSPSSSSSQRRVFFAGNPSFCIPTFPERTTSRCFRWLGWGPRHVPPLEKGMFCHPPSGSPHTGGCLRAAVPLCCTTSLPASPPLPPTGGLQAPHQGLQGQRLPDQAAPVRPPSHFGCPDKALLDKGQVGAVGLFRTPPPKRHTVVRNR